VKVVSRVNAPALRALQTQIGVIEGIESPAVQAEIAQMKQQQGLILAFGRASNPVQRTIIVPYMEPKPTIRPEFEEANGLRIVRNRLIVDLKDFLSFDVALEIADRIGAELVGHFPITNSYVLDLRRAPKDLQALEAIMAQVGRDPRVAEVWQDFALELRQVRFADVDVVDRYRHNYNANLNGREDVWGTDRIQAPGAWNLIERFIGRDRLNAVKVAVMDTGCDHTHREFTGVDLRKVVYGHKVGVRIAGREEILPLPASFDDSQAYNLGDPDVTYQHGTRVTSLIGARNGNVLDANHNDRGMNGLLHNPMSYTIQVYRGGDWHEGNSWTTHTEFISVINMAALTRASVMNASWGQPHPVNPTTSVHRNTIRVALRKLAHQLNLFRNRLLLVVAAGNEAQNPDPEGMRGWITPFEDLNLNNTLDAGEDFNSNGILDHGNYVAASLGTLPNVITVGAIGGSDNLPGPGRDWARDDQRADFSNWGVPVQIAAPGTDVFTAGGGDFAIGGARFSRSDGTSFATPLTAGSAALLKAIAPNLTPQGMKNYLLNTAFEVNTTDGNGNMMVWKTLKTGYAVRQLMVDRGIIQNDQQWTGVSKVVYDGLRMFEVRRGPNGRAQAFADRALPGLGGIKPSLAHHGSAVIWIADERTVKQHLFATGATGNLVVLNPGFQLEPILDAAPDLNYLFGVRTLDGDCNRRVEVYAGPNRVADTGDFNICAFGIFGARAWQQYFLHKAAWRPDSRAWALDYFHTNGVGNVTNQECRAWWGDNPFPAAPLPFPGCTGTEFRYPAWAPDGRAYAGGSSAVDLDIAYYNSSHRHLFTRRANIANSPLRWLHWSPDGSELGYHDANGISTVRRDYRAIADRNPLMLQGGMHGVFTWQW
ncbi:MAG: S8 family serine peptidase, partial [Fimbriimonadales bacterium]|nr:S8 family serine peptidase [Fimbriimonadales bacterium]